MQESDLPKVDRAIHRFGRRHAPFLRRAFRNGYWIFFAWVFLASLLSSVFSLTYGGAWAWSVPMMIVLFAMLHSREAELTWSSLSRVVVNPVVMVFLTFPLDVFQVTTASGIVAARVVAFVLAAWQHDRVGAYIFGPKFERMKAWEPIVFTDEGV